MVKYSVNEVGFGDADPAALNDSGDCVGNVGYAASTPDGFSEYRSSAITLRGGDVKYLTAPKGAVSSVLADINNKGAAVGWWTSHKGSIQIGHPIAVDAVNKITDLLP